ncbi:MAG: class I SAM-dependent methyltransferase [Acidobacteria bacterium]|nr:class I SAM-dependent methyltransferase [Acidobacteriota bacterium]
MELAAECRSEKAVLHKYIPHYEHHFDPIRFLEMNILEIGIGGYKFPKAGGDSLRMWRDYFPNARIYGIDIYDKSAHDGERIKTFRGSQDDPRFLGRVCDEIGEIDIVIDDGSHVSEHVITSFKVLFPRLRSGGVYVVEDLQYAYWRQFEGVEYGGDARGGNRETSMTFFKSLVDGLNHQNFVEAGYEPTYFDKNVVAMHFYHNQVFIYKGTNDEPSFHIDRIKDRLLRSADKARRS